MTILRMVGLLAALGAPGYALPDEPPPQAQSLAAGEAILQYCAKIMPAAADQFRGQAQMLAQGVDEETLAKVRKSREYRESHDSMLESLAKVGENDAKQACAQHLGQNP